MISDDALVGVAINGKVYVDTLKNLRTPVTRTPVEHEMAILNSIPRYLLPPFEGESA